MLRADHERRGRHRSLSGPAALCRTWGTPRDGAAARCRRTCVRAVYRLWLAALALKLLGSSWDVSWHFRWLRDDLAPPHLLNTAGTVLVVALVAFHTWTGLRRRPADAAAACRSGIGIFLLASRST